MHKNSFPVENHKTDKTYPLTESCMDPIGGKKIEERNGRRDIRSFAETCRAHISSEFKTFDQ